MFTKKTLSNKRKKVKLSNYFKLIFIYSSTIYRILYLYTRLPYRIFNNQLSLLWRSQENLNSKFLISSQVEDWIAIAYCCSSTIFVCLKLVEFPSFTTGNINQILSLESNLGYEGFLLVRLKPVCFGSTRIVCSFSLGYR